MKQEPTVGAVSKEVGQKVLHGLEMAWHILQFVAVLTQTPGKTVERVCVGLRAA